MLVTFLVEEKMCSVNSDQFAFEKLMNVKSLELYFFTLFDRIIKIGRWSELSLFSTFQVYVGMRLSDARLMSGAVDA